MVDWNHPIQTICGNPARVATTLGPEGLVIVLVDSGDHQVVVYCERDGKIRSGWLGSDDAIVNIPRTRTIWINCYRHTHEVYESEEEAHSRAFPARLACIRVSYGY